MTPWRFELYNRRFLILFYLRLSIYLVAVGIPIFHPAVVVSYDSLIRWLWFLLVPAQMHIAFYLSPPKFNWKVWVGTSIGLMAISVFVFTGTNGPIGLFLLAQAAAFFTTVLVFRSRGLLRPFVFFEMVLLLLLLVRLLGFSRASEDFAAASSTITQGILAISAGVVLLHGFILYLSVYGEGIRRRSAKELLFFLTVAIAIGVAVALFMPPDFVNHSISLNDLRNPPDPDFIPLDESGDGLENGNLRSEGQSGQNEGNGEDEGEQGEEGSESDNQRLQGIPAEQWESRTGSGSGGESESGGEGQGQPQNPNGQGENKQYAVMVVVGNEDPIYAADAYFEKLDPVRGFTISRENPLNELSYIRLIETWENPSRLSDLGREMEEVFFLSTESTRFLPYYPQAVQPTVLNRVYHPFDFSYASLSAISKADFDELDMVIGLNQRDKEQMAPYLEVDLPDEIYNELALFLDEFITEEQTYFGKLQAILSNFSSFQYNIGFTDDISVGHIMRFLLDTRDGDCSEFSNATAILARMAGIPSRVVTGYLASSGLQTRMHKQGLIALREVIEPLQEFPLEQMFLVTTAHRHSWTQVFLPPYGWIDIETTATALPPAGGLDPNSADIIIPIIEPDDVTDRRFEFPWLLALQSLLVLLVAGTVGAYVFRYSRLLYHRTVAKGESVRSLRSLYTLLLMKLAVEGYPIKPGSRTAKEYAEEHPELTSFADLYTSLRYRERLSGDSRKDEMEKLRREYRDVVTGAKRSGIPGLMRRVFSLRDLRY